MEVFGGPAIAGTLQPVENLANRAATSLIGVWEYCKLDKDLSLKKRECTTGNDVLFDALEWR